VYLGVFIRHHCRACLWCNKVVRVTSLFDGLLLSVSVTTTCALLIPHAVSAGRLVHDFLWEEFADWYLEASKVRLRNSGSGATSSLEEQAAQWQTQHQTRRVLVYVWDSCLRLLHPYMPYLTELLWQQIPHLGESIMLADWPQMRNQTGTADSGEACAQEALLPVDATATAQFRALQEIVKAIRNARAQYAVEPGRKVPCILVVQDAPLRAVLQQERAIFALLGRVQEEDLTIISAEEQSGALSAAGACVHLVVQDGVEVFLPQSGLVDAAKERQRLGKQAEKVTKDIAVLSARLESAGFSERAPPQLVAESRQKLADMQEQLRTINASLDALN
jgi:valyl-tRNA synthetase